jgi:hypothetical protein
VFEDREPCERHFNQNPYSRPRVFGPIEDRERPPIARPAATYGSESAGDELPQAVGYADPYHRPRKRLPPR